MKQAIQHILDLVSEIRNTTDNAADIWPTEGIAKIESLVEQGLPIHMVLPAFPAKSPNTKKIVSHRPDYGEVLALGRLNQLCERIAEVYKPGARLTICSDGRVFSDVVQVSDELVNSYSQGIREIISTFKFQNLDLFGLEDLFAALDYESMRQRLMDEFGEDIEILRARTKLQHEAKNLFNGIHRFMFEDQLSLHPDESRNSLREKAKGLAYEVILRSNAWSRLVEREFPQALRLSIHPQPSSSVKIGIRLLPSNDAWRTPWHSVAVFDGKDFFLAPRAHVEAAGGMLTYAHNRYPYYFLEARTDVTLPPQGVAL